MLLDKKIGISISRSSNLAERGFGDVHLRDIAIEFSRYLLLNGARLVYGHNLRKGGYAELFAMLNQRYTPDHLEGCRCINYLHETEMAKLAQTDLMEYERAGIEIRGQVDLKEKADGELRNEEDADVQYWCTSLHQLRVQMTQASDARIFIGGATDGFKGSLPGVIEEAVLAIRARQPVFFIGAFGGATEVLTHAVDGAANAYMIADQKAEQFSDVKSEQSLLSLQEAFNELGSLGIEGLSKLNGLSITENERLFETPHISEMVRLVMIGLQRSFSVG